MTKNYFNLVLLLALGLGSVTAHAQADFQPGYIVQPAGDTVRGEVDYRDARFNNNQCRFRATPAAIVTTFVPATLRAYGLHDGSKVYRSRVPVSMLAPATSSTPVFLEVLVDGPAQLYSLRDNEGTDHYYVATQTFPLTELVQRKVLLEEERRLQTQNIYRNTLSQALPNCPAAQALLPSLAYTAQALARAVATYNQCVAPQNIVALARQHALLVRPRYHSRFGVLVGGQQATMHVQYAQAYGSDIKLDFGPLLTPVIGVSLNVPLTALSNKLSIEADLFYEGESYKKTYLNTYYGGSYYSAPAQYSFTMKYLRLPLLVRYTFPKGRVRPFIEGGPTLAYAIQLKNEVVLTDAYGKVAPPVGFFQNNFRQLQEGLAGGVGIQADYWQGRQASLLLRAEGDTGWAGGSGLSTWSNRFYILLTFGLNK